MSDDERAKNTHCKDDPQQWPGERNTVGIVAGRILGVLLLTLLCTLGFYLIQNYRSPISTLGVFIVGAWGYFTPRVLTWGMTRRL